MYKKKEPDVKNVWFFFGKVRDRGEKAGGCGK